MYLDPLDFAVENEHVAWIRYDLTKDGLREIIFFDLIEYDYRELSTIPRRLEVAVLEDFGIKITAALIHRDYMGPRTLRITMRTPKIAIYDSLLFWMCGWMKAQE